jgi:2-polyprenyl-3-methyl-5-hydroxy-6-metoxy-1,4-benzoquinol methylase
MARRKLADVRRGKTPRETQLLIDALNAVAPRDATVLDIGAGVGAVHGALLEHGAAKATSVDASSAYATAARELAHERGYEDRVTYQAGDFVDIAASIEAVDVVALDKVVCCYPDAQRLVALSADRARHVWGFVAPHDRPVHRLFSRVHNAFEAALRRTFRTYVHPQPMIEALLRERGFRLRSETGTRVWAVRVYERA